MFKKRWFKIIASILGILIVVGVIFHFWALHVKAGLSKRYQNLVELPKDVVYSKITSSQQKDLLTKIAKEYPSQNGYFTSKDNKEISLPFFQEITFTQNKKIIPSDQIPPQGDVTIEPTKLSPSSSKSTSEQSSNEPSQPAGSRGGENQPEDQDQPSQTPPSSSEQQKKSVEVGTIFIAGENYVSSGNIGGIEGANKKCQQAAEKENYNGNWMALLSSVSSEIKYRLPDAVYKNVLGQIVAKDKTSLFSGQSLQNPILFTDGKKMDTESVSGRVATGADEWATGGVFSEAEKDSCHGTCKDWTSSDSTCEGIVGKPDKLYKGWLAGEKMNCTLPGFTLYCVKSEEVEKVPGGPTIYYYAFTRGPQTREQVQAELYKIKAAVEKYYPKVVEIYGQPYDLQNRNFYVIYDIQASSFINPQYGWITLGNSSPGSVVMGLEAAFSGKYFSKIPQTWEYGMMLSAADQIFRQTNETGITESSWANLIRSDYEKFNTKDYPIWGTNIFYSSEILPVGYIYRMLTASVAMSKPYQYDKDFFKKIHQKLYSIPLDSNLWTEDRWILDSVESVFPNSIDGLSPQDWYWQQHVLHQTETNPETIAIMKEYGQTFAIKPSGVSNLGLYSFSSTFGENPGFIPKNGRSMQVRVRTDRDEVKINKAYSSNSEGEALINLQQEGITDNGRYSVQVGWTDNRTSFDFFAYDNNNQLRGTVNNFGEGKIGAYDQSGNLIQEIEIVHGAFSLAQMVGKQGIFKLKVKDYNGEQVLEKELAKDIFGYFAVLDSPTQSFPSQTGSRGGSAPSLSPPQAQNCDNIDTSNWKNYQYDQYGFTFKYPSDWQVKQEQIGSTPGPIQWFVHFGPGGTKTVSIGGSAYELGQFKQLITSNQMSPVYKIEKEEKATLDGREGTKLTVKDTGQNFLAYLYYFPPFNVPYVLRGPALEESSFFTKCEPQIFQKMLETFKFPKMPGEGESVSPGTENEAYANLDCKFTLEYPNGWEMKENYYYETAGGSKATVPTIVFAKKGSATNTITINGRQTFCQGEQSKSQESVDGRTVTISDLGGNNWCAQAEIEGLDINGKKATYTFVSYYDDSQIKDAFKLVVKSFKEMK